MTDLMKCEILEDGTLSVTTDAISAANHMSADEMLDQLFKMVGGPVEVKKRMRLDVNAQIHEHAHYHSH